MPDHKGLALDTVKELIKQQREDFSSMLESLMNSFNTRYDKLHSEISDLKHSLEYSQRQIEEMGTKQAGLAESNIVTDNEINAVKKDLNDLSDKADYLENQSRRNNVLFGGIPESPQESWEDTEKKVASVLRENMGFTEIPHIERAHRIGKASEMPRSIVAKLTHYKDRDTILRSGRNLKGSNIYVRDDVSERVQKRRKDQMEKLKEAKNQGKIAYFILDRLVVKDRRVDDPVTRVDRHQVRPNTRAYSHSNQETG